MPLSGACGSAAVGIGVPAGVVDIEVVRDPLLNLQQNGVGLWVLEEKTSALQEMVEGLVVTAVAVALVVEEECPVSHVLPVEAVVCRDNVLLLLWCVEQRPRADGTVRPPARASVGEDLDDALLHHREVRPSV